MDSLNLKKGIGKKGVAELYLDKFLCWLYTERKRKRSKFYTLVEKDKKTLNWEVGDVFSNFSKFVYL